MEGEGCVSRGLHGGKVSLNRPNVTTSPPGICYEFRDEKSLLALIFFGNNS